MKLGCLVARGFERGRGLFFGSVFASTQVQSAAIIHKQPIDMSFTERFSSTLSQHDSNETAEVKATLGGSKYEIAVVEAEKLDKGESFSVDSLSSSEVQGIRQQIYRSLGKIHYRVSSATNSRNGKYTVLVEYLTDKQAEQREKRLANQNGEAKS